MILSGTLLSGIEYSGVFDIKVFWHIPGTTGRGSVKQVSNLGPFQKLLGADQQIGSQMLDLSRKYCARISKLTLKVAALLETAGCGSVR